MSESVADAPTAVSIPASSWADFPLVVEYLSRRNISMIDPTGAFGRPLVHFTGTAFEITWVSVH